ncbi:MAG: glycosyltransferase family 39 protein [candidate division Zixibacteria bacterium]|nr:glycosyltransferase family 39 protein [candidate division Zixibacteria bacterium]
MVKLAIKRLMSDRPSWQLPLLIFAAALLVRLVYLYQIQSMPTFDYPVMDEQYHIQVASQINSSQGFPDEPYYRAPLYPYFLAVLLQIFGDSLFFPRLIQIFLGSLLPVVLFFITRMLLSQTMALWVAGAAVLYPTYLYYDASLLIESIMPLLVAILLWQCLRSQIKPTALNFAAIGILLGLTALARPNILFFAPALLVWIFWIIRPLIGLKKSLIAYSIIGLCIIVAILPVTVRNYLVSGDHVLIAWQGGFNFFIGNNRLSNGWSATVPGVDATWEGGYREVISIAEQEAGHPLAKSEVSDFWYDASWQELRENPSLLPTLILLKTRLIFNGYEIPNNHSDYITRDYSSLISMLMFDFPFSFPFGILAPLAVLGIGLGLTHFRKFMLLYLLLFSYLASLLMFFVCGRFRQPIMALFIFFAVFAVMRLVAYFRQRNLKGLLLFLLVFALLAIESNHNILGIDSARVRAEESSLLGNAFLRQGKIDEAGIRFHTAITSDPTYAQGYNNLGNLSMKRGQKKQAALYFEIAVAKDSTLFEPYMNLATTYVDAGRNAEAIYILELARARFPNNDYVHLKLGMTYFEAGRVVEAERSVERALKLNPVNTTAIQVAQQIRNRRR